MIKKCGVIFFPAFDWAISPTHPEREERLLYTRDQLFEEGIMDFDNIKEYKPILAEDLHFVRTHFCIGGVDEQITNAHRAAVGAGLTLMDKIIRKEIRHGFALVRPPGHHGMRVMHGNRGFCNSNNMAILVDYLRSVYKIQRIVIVDTDVHHGDGTQDIFYHDPDVLYISFHQDGRTLYPGTGFCDECGGPLAKGFNINLPLPPGAGDKSIMWLFKQIINPIINDFKPDFILNSAGQDNHFTDPLASMNVSALGYAKLTEVLQPDMILLEGGYGVESCLPYVNLGILAAISGLDYSKIVEPERYHYDLSEPKQIQSWLNQLEDNVMSIWQYKAKQSCDYRYENNRWIKDKTIFYDTSNISESQQESIFPCNNCQGYLTIATSADGFGIKSKRALCISVPPKACQNCVNKAEELFFNSVYSNNTYNYLYLQNKRDDIYRYVDRSKSNIICEIKSGG